MKLRLLLACTLLLAAGGLAQILSPVAMGPSAPAAGGNPAFVNIGTGSFFINTAPDVVSTAAQNVTAGNTLYVGCGVAQDGSAPTGVTVTDTAGDTFTRDVSVNNVNTNRGVVAFHVASSIGNANNVTTCHLPNSTGDVAVITLQISNAGALDATATGENHLTNASPVTSGTFSTTRANEISIAFVMSNFGRATNTFTASSGYTIPAGGSVVGGAGDNFAAIEYQIFTATQSGVTAGFSWSGGAGYAAVAVSTF